MSIEDSGYKKGHVIKGMDTYLVLEDSTIVDGCIANTLVSRIGRPEPQRLFFVISGRRRCKVERRPCKETRQWADEVLAEYGRGRL